MAEPSRASTAAKLKAAEEEGDALLDALESKVHSAAAASSSSSVPAIPPKPALAAVPAIPPKPAASPPPVPPKPAAPAIPPKPASPLLKPLRSPKSGSAAAKKEEPPPLPAAPKPAPVVPTLPSLEQREPEPEPEPAAGGKKLSLKTPRELLNKVLRRDVTISQPASGAAAPETRKSPRLDEAGSGEDKFYGTGELSRSFSSDKVSITEGGMPNLTIDLSAARGQLGDGGGAKKLRDSRSLVSPRSVAMLSPRQLLEKVKPEPDVPEPVISGPRTLARAAVEPSSVASPRLGDAKMQMSNRFYGSADLSKRFSQTKTSETDSGEVALRAVGGKEEEEEPEPELPEDEEGAHGEARSRYTSLNTMFQEPAKGGKQGRFSASNSPKLTSARKLLGNTLGNVKKMVTRSPRDGSPRSPKSPKEPDAVPEFVQASHYVDGDRYMAGFQPEGRWYKEARGIVSSDKYWVERPFKFATREAAFRDLNCCLVFPQEMALGLNPASEQCQHYVGRDPSLGSLVLSIADGSAVLWCFRGAYDLSLDADTQTKLRASARSRERVLRKVLNTDFRVSATFERASVDISPTLVQMQREARNPTCKMGVLLRRKGQSREDEMLGNTETTPAFEAFLNLLGVRVELQGWEQFRGGLDVKRGSTGTHSVFTTTSVESVQFQIMYHVCQLLPESEGNLERKRHLGNDVVLIVFLEDPSEPLDPGVFSGEFVHVVVAVYLDAKGQYHMNVALRDGVPREFPPLFPAKGMSADEFRKLLLCKLLNAERVALKAPAFASKLERVRRQQLDDLVSSATKQSFFTKSAE